MIRPDHKTCFAAIFALLPIFLFVSASTAQTTQPATLTADIAADEELLWLVEVRRDKSVAHRREINTPFLPVAPLNRPIVELAATDATLYAFLADGQFWSLTASDWRRETDLPERQRPLDLCSSPQGLFAIAPSPPAGELLQLVEGQRPTTTQPFDPAGASLSVVRYDSRGWAALAACPPDVEWDKNTVGPRVGWLGGGVCILWANANAERIHCRLWDPRAAEWKSLASSPRIDGLVDFWLLNVNRIPTIIAETVVAPDTPDAFQMLGNPHDAPWQSATLDLSDMPDGKTVTGIISAAPFNQHAALLCQTTPGEFLLRFARTDVPPSEKTVAVTEIFAGQRLKNTAYEWFQGLTVLVLMAVLLSLFMFRRGAMVMPVTLPEDTALALTFQRMLGLAIDLVPFAAIAAGLLGVSMREGFEELLGWAIGWDAATGRLPSPETLIWWAASCTGYTVYCGFVELLSHRTLGKVLTGTHVYAENGEKPKAWQILVRNAMRLIELTPALWVLGFLVVLSRNRQRLGDIFARTVVIRHTKPTDDTPTEQ